MTSELGTANLRLEREGPIAWCVIDRPAARTAGIDAIDAPYPAYDDPDGYRRSAVHASLLGYDGKWAIHPSQVPIANEVFSPTPQEVDEARLSIEIYRKSEADGVGAIGRDGKLVDAAHMRLAENTLYKASLSGDEEVGEA